MSWHEIVAKQNCSLRAITDEALMVCSDIALSEARASQLLIDINTAHSAHLMLLDTLVAESVDPELKDQAREIAEGWKLLTAIAQNRLDLILRLSNAKRSGHLN